MFALKGLFGRVGTWGQGIAQGIAKGFTTIKKVVGQFQDIGIPLDAEIMGKEVGEAIRVGALPEKIEGFRGEQMIPQSLYQEASLLQPIADNYQYTVHSYGRHVAGHPKGGQFYSMDVSVLSSYRLSPEEIEEIAKERFGAEGPYPKFSAITSMKITGAYYLEGDETW